MNEGTQGFIFILNGEFVLLPYGCGKPIAKAKNIGTLYNSIYNLKFKNRGIDDVNKIKFLKENIPEIEKLSLDDKKKNVADYISLLINNTGSLHGVIVSGDSGIGKTQMLFDTFEKLDIREKEKSNHGLLDKLYLCLDKQKLHFSIIECFGYDSFIASKIIIDYFNNSNKNINEYELDIVNQHKSFLLKDFDGFIHKLLFAKEVENNNSYSNALSITNSMCDKVIDYYKNKESSNEIIEYIKKHNLPLLDDDTKPNYFIVKGSVSDKGLYRCLYENKDSIIVFDDSDSIFTSKRARNIIKGAIDSYEIRKVSWLLGEKLNDDDLPSEFIFTGKIIMFTNIPINDIEHAIITRCYSTEIITDKEEMYNVIKNNIEGILPDINSNIKHEVLDYLNSLSVKINYRMFISALELRIMFENSWQTKIKLMSETWN